MLRQHPLFTKKITHIWVIFISKKLFLTMFDKVGSLVSYNLHCKFYNVFPF